MPVALAPPLAPARRLPFEEVGGGSKLFRAYAAGDPTALRFFARDWRSAADLEAAAEEAAVFKRDRDALVDVLAEQNAAWGNADAPTERSLSALRHPCGVAVVTGQQLGLFGGPLYTVYKAVTAVQLARHLSVQTGRPVAPVFWMAGEDHDWEEVRATAVLGANEPVRIELPPSADRVPVGRRPVGEGVEGALAALAETLRPTEFTPDLEGALRAAYRPGATHRDAFGRWMAHLFAGTGLVLMSPDDARLKRLAAPVFRAEIEDPAATLGPLLEVGGELESAGYHQQVTPLPGNLFLMEPEGRYTLDPEGGGEFVLRGLGRRYSRESLLALLEAEPERFSPNVVLRPIVEDRLLPTVAYVAGPGEAAYYAQLREVYARFGVPMPVVYPRASVTLVEAKVQRALSRLGLSVADLAGDVEALHRRLVLSESTLDVEASFLDAARALHAVADAVKPVAEAADPTLARSAEALRANLQKELAALEAKVVRAEKRNHDGLRDQLDKARANLFPFDAPQERVLSPLYVLNKYGPDLVPRLIDGLHLDTAEHQVVEV